jgi:ketosteroid isomerase-like protein
MQRSSDVESLVREFYDAMRRGDATALGRLIADHDEVLFIGTDPAEWWEGHDTVIATMRDQMEAMGGGIELVGGDPRGFQSGDLGWFADRPSFRLSDGTEVPTRLTGVASRQSDQWRVVHSHISVGVSNEEAVGRDLPT